jgi:hypothetical protein
VSTIHAFKELERKVVLRQSTFWNKFLNGNPV